MAKLNGVKTLDMVNGEITKVEYDGALYKKVGVKGGKSGDLGLRIKDDCVYAKIGEFYPITANANGRLEFADDVGSLPYVAEELEKFVYFRKISADQSPTSEYRLVTDREPKTGDFAKITATGDDDLTVGKYYEIHYIDDDGDFGITDDTGHSSYIMNSDGDYFEVYEKVTAHEPVSLRPTIGNVVKVIGRQSHHRAAIGDFVKIVEDLHDWQPYRCEFLNGDGAGWFRDSEVILATDEEVASAMKEQAEAKAEARWAKIGRKPNEFKKGDIVRFVPSKQRVCHGLINHSGLLTEVESVSNSGITLAKPNFVESSSGTHTLLAELTLITPVEQRFDFAEASA